MIDGKERALFHDNPWMELAFMERRKASTLFNKGRYASAKDVLRNVLDKLPEKERIFFKSFSEIVEGYELWDRFKHKDARIKIRRNLDLFKAYCYGSKSDKLIELAEHIKRNVEFLEKLINEGGIYYFYDLLANAKRRAYLEEKYDDAVARLYRSLEFFAQNRLSSKYSIDTSRVEIGAIPAGLREEFERKYKSSEGKIELPLYASYILLKELKDEAGEKFVLQYENKLKYLLSSRNRSILAHGFESVSKDTYEKFYLSILEFTGTDEDSLPDFPQIEL